MKTAKQFDWQTKPLPPQRSTVALDRRFSAHEIQRMRLGLVPEEMEDKWFVYWENDRLFFHRSWTGNCIYIVRFAAEGDSYRMVEAEVNRDPEQYREINNALDVRMISYLIDVLLLKQDAEFPSEEQDPERKAFTKWSQVGRAMLGQYPKNE
jgi:hypothetical protein